MEGISPADIAALNKDGDGFGNSWLGMIIVLFFLVYGMNGSYGGNGFANAIGYENLATSNEVQRGFDNQNSMANQRDILAAVNAGTAQSVAATNQTFHDTLGIIQNRYDELSRDVSGIAIGQAQALANQNSCCCETKMLIQQVAADNALQMSQLEARLVQKMDANDIASLREQVHRLELGQAMQGVVRYPDSFAYNAGSNPFCGCNQGCCNI